jgi:hypothetical protein
VDLQAERDAFESDALQWKEDAYAASEKLTEALSDLEEQTALVEELRAKLAEGERKVVDEAGKGAQLAALLADANEQNALLDEAVHR